MCVQRFCLGWTAELTVGLWLVIPKKGFEHPRVDLTRFETLRLNHSPHHLLRPVVCYFDQNLSICISIYVSTFLFCPRIFLTVSLPFQVITGTVDLLRLAGALGFRFEVHLTKISRSPMAINQTALSR